MDACEYFKCLCADCKHSEDCIIGGWCRDCENGSECIKKCDKKEVIKNGKD